MRFKNLFSLCVRLVYFVFYLCITHHSSFNIYDLFHGKLIDLVIHHTVKIDYFPSLLDHILVLSVAQNLLQRRFIAVAGQFETDYATTGG